MALWGLWSITKHQWYCVGDVVLSTTVKRFVCAQLITLKRQDPEVYKVYGWIVRRMGRDGKPATSWWDGFVLP